MRRHSSSDPSIRSDVLVAGVIFVVWLITFILIVVGLLTWVLGSLS